MRKQNPLHWQAHEYEERVRGADWFWAVGILTVAISVTAVILGNILFALVILLSGFSLSLYAARKPRLVDIVLSDKGVRIDNYFYPYHALESFWVDEHSSSPKALIKSQKLFMPYIIVPLVEVNPEWVRHYLSRHLPEIFHSESVFHKLMDHLGF
ncbi:hypothetical protein EPN83_03290 [Patescibacteria group bacterium]|nr:MAG: hypothetical protein EPN83_03290 [Patescibacteria group bacterium]